MYTIALPWYNITKGGVHIAYSWDYVPKGKKKKNVYSHGFKVKMLAGFAIEILWLVALIEFENVQVTAMPPTSTNKGLGVLRNNILWRCWEVHPLYSGCWLNHVLCVAWLKKLFNDKGSMFMHLHKGWSQYVHPLCCVWLAMLYMQLLHHAIIAYKGQIGILGCWLVHLRCMHSKIFLFRGTFVKYSTRILYMCTQGPECMPNHSASIIWTVRM